MRLRLTGAVLITCWLALNLALALGIVVAIVVLGRHPPSLALYVEAGVRSTLHPQVLALVDGLAVFANACAAAFCALALVVTWKGVVPGLRWALPSLSVIGGLLLAAGFASDASLGHDNLAANVGSSVMLGSGLLLCGLDRSP
ncbi:MAG: hypothetical protein JNM69_12970 [Archangium sp.]|nr:hypothetical protein [Archangium sp.]